MEIKRIFDLLPNYLEKYPDQPVALAGKKDGEWRKYSMKEYIELTDKLSWALIELGIEVGDKVASIVSNRPEWNIIDMAVMQIGAINVPIYPTISQEDYHYILNDCEAKLVFLDGVAVMNKVTNVLSDIPSIKYVYTMVDRDKYPYFDQIIALGTLHPHKEELERRKAAVKSSDCMTLIYTSGTTGTPKGVMLSHSNVINQVLGVYDIIPCKPGSIAFSFLPECHAYERLLIYTYQYLGMAIYYAESLATLADNIKELRPSMMCCVPRVLERFYDGIIASGKKMSGASKSIFFWAVHLAERYKIDDNERDWLYNLKLRIADKLVYSKIRAKIGADRFERVVSGAAALNHKIAAFFSAIQMPVFEGYGLTETSPVIAVSNKGAHQREVGCVGPPLRGVDVKITEEGEIVCRGHNVMMGYYKHPELTAEVIDSDGWFHTGDMGQFNENGLLMITGRIKSLFKTSGGKYINPDVIETKFTGSKLIEQIVVVGENQKFAGALIVPSFAFLKGWCAKEKIRFTTPEQVINLPEVQKLFFKEVQEMNKGLGETEKIKKFTLIADEWSVGNGLITPTLKVKRRAITAKYKDVIDKMFAEN
ncbi:MAG: long-chain fatty acid--CoA ligase [Bacteroidales bacterium]|nr:long-chain fatty acid--CoA ligase [Bacteroidales bacterium]